MGTPNGPNHFRDQWYERYDDESWFHAFLPYQVTKILSDEDISEMRKIMDPEQFAQELECSFEASVRGAIYARQVEQSIADGRIGYYPLDKTTNTEVFMDIGFKDQSTMGFVQRRFDGVLLGASHGDSMKKISHYIDYIQDFWESNGLKPGQIWLPHDAKAKSLQTGRAIIDHFRTANLRPRLVPKLDVIDGIAAMRTMWPQFYIHEPLNKKFILAAKTYHRKYDEELKRYSDEPVHDWSSDWMDMGRYISLVANPAPRVSERRRERKVSATQGSHYAFSLNDLWDDKRNEDRRIYG
jgi:hypothetical protein